jgi:hypothetical protein
MMPKVIATIIILLMTLIILATPATASQTGINVNASERLDSDFIVTIEMGNTVDLNTYSEEILATWTDCVVTVTGTA